MDIRSSWHPWMLSEVFGGLRPWELQDFTRVEFELVERYREALVRVRTEDDPAGPGNSEMDAPLPDTLTTWDRR